MKRALLLALPALAACALVAREYPTTGTATARLNETAIVGIWSIRPVAVIEDSRCPLLVRCVWAGRLVVRTMTNAGAGEDVLDLTLGEPRKMDNAGYLTLVDAQPPKAATEAIKPEDYRFTFRFEAANRP